MSSSNGHTPVALKAPVEAEQSAEEFLSIDQVQHLIRLIDQSDVAEIEVRHASKHARFVLRKAGAPVEHVIEPSSVPEAASAPPNQPHYTVTAPLVGLFHCWSKTKEKLSIAVGECVKQGQHI